MGLAGPKGHAQFNALLRTCAGENASEKFYSTLPDASFQSLPDRPTVGVV
jgi:hypothetical protein